MTNATKAVILGLVNTGLGLLVAFNVALTQAQSGAILAFVSACGTAWVALTYQSSAKRLPDGAVAVTKPGGTK